MRQLVEEITLNTLDPCVWRYVLNQDDLASFRLKVRSDVIGTWEIASTTYNHFYCQVKIVVSGCGFKSAISKSKKTHLGLKVDEDSVAIAHTWVLLLPPSLSKLSQEAFYRLKRGTTPTTGEARAYHESQSQIFKTEAPQFVGAGEGTDNLDFLPRSTSVLLEQLKQESVQYSHCACCKETPKTRGMLKERYYEIHHVVPQPSCCAPPSVFQTIMRVKLQLRQANFDSCSKNRVLLKEKTQCEDAKDILGATCAAQEDKTKVRYVKMHAHISPRTVTRGADADGVGPNPPPPKHRCAFFSCITNKAQSQSQSRH